MLIKRINADGSLASVDAVSDIGNIDYVDSDGKIVYNAPCKGVMIRTSSDLDLLANEEVGTVAFTAGFGSMWQKDASGTWQSM